MSKYETATRSRHRRADFDLAGASCKRREPRDRRLAISGRLDVGRQGNQSPRVVAMGGRTTLHSPCLSAAAALNPVRDQLRSRRSG